MRTGVAAAALLVALAGCGSGGEDSPTVASPPATTGAADVVEVQPGAPGEGSTTRNPAEPVPTDPGSHADIAFLQMMTLHHRQALDMGELAEDRAGDGRVRRVAARIAAAQSPEILVMAGWLTQRGVEVPVLGADPAEYDHSAHGHAGMVGMLTEQEMAALTDARGTDFDRLYLEGMIRHHEGAIAMARDVLTAGGETRVNELATDIVSGQGAEIMRLRRLLESLKA